MDFNQKVALLREKMAQDNVKALLVTCNDPHQSGAVAQHWKAVQWLTGFTGSLATAVITPDHAAFWTDSRYDQQAKKEIGNAPIEQYNVHNVDHPTYVQWILQHTKVGDVLALDGKVLGLFESRALQQNLAQNQLQIATQRDYINEVWAGQRPSIPTDPLFELDVAYAGEDRKSKIQKIRKAMQEKGATCFITSSLDDIGWFTNLRGFDLPRLPIFHAYLILTTTEVKLFTGLEKISPELKQKLQADGYTLYPMEDVFAQAKLVDKNAIVYLDPQKTGVLLFQSLPQEVKVIEGMDLITFAKSMKNPIEIQNLRQGCIYECAALAKLIKYIKDNIQNGIDEYTLGSEVLEQFRKQCKDYIMPGNVPIVAYMANAAMAHYRPGPNNTTVLKPEGFFLFDVCGHYYQGTTDITRTVACGPLSQEMIEDYTITLKSHLAMAMLRFPYPTTGNIIDGIVKHHHWNNYRHFGHGTGHGFGYLLDIHDGPCRIGITHTPTLPYGLTTPLEVGMVFSDEPGVYKPDRWGIRIENDVVVQEDITNEFARFMKFETLTYCPYEREAIDKSMLSQEEVEWINQYHAQCYQRLSAFMNQEECAWLKEVTKPL